MTKPKQYASSAAFRTALEERLNRTARKNNQDIARLRRQVAFDRFLARLFSGEQSGHFALKGGYGLELRFHKARTTKDIDICVYNHAVNSADGEKGLLIMIRQAATFDLGDYFEYIVGESVLDLQNAPYGGYRFPIECRMAGRRFARFNVDIAAGDVWLDTHEELTGNHWLDFAGIQAPKIPTICVEQQFAEKIHSYSLPRQTPNSRVKDLVDLILLIEGGSLDTVRLRDAVIRTFRRRKTHIIPAELEDPPESWKIVFAKIAEECGIPVDLDSAMSRIRQVHKSLFP